MPRTPSNLVRTSFMIQPGKLRRLRAQARRRGTTVSELLRTAINEFLATTHAGDPTDD
jgi:hypothetical protein